MSEVPLYLVYTRLARFAYLGKAGGGMGLMRVQGFGFRVWGLGFRVQGLGFRV